MVDEALARLLIAEIPMRYARGVDQRDWDLVASVFVPGAQVAGTYVSGPFEEYFPKLRVGVEEYGRTMHFMGNQVIDFIDDDAARLETYCIAHHFASTEGNPTLIMGVRYLDDVVHTSGNGWRIASRKVFPDWSRRDEELEIPQR